MPHDNRQIQVILLTQAHCNLCEEAKTSLTRLATQYPLTIVPIDLGTTEGRVLAARGGMVFPPGILLDGEPFSFGCLPERKLRRELEQRLAARSAVAVDGTKAQAGI